MCQCPKSGKPHFYIVFTVGDYDPHRCQCPKSGKPHFYESCGNPERHRGTMCQCPKSGKPHFYVDTGEVSDEHFNVCQCPKSGKPHFYPALLEPAYLAALRACFCRYVSEYSDNQAETGLKVGRRQIVLF